MQVELLNTGTELLMGLVVNTHASWLGQQISRIGGTLARQVAVGDDKGVMIDAISAALNRADLLLVTGGLGPTGDDITRNCVIEMFKLPTRIDQAVIDNIQQRFLRRGVVMPESIKCQAVIPIPGTVFHNRHGTAPGLAIPVRQLNGMTASRCQWIVMLPGPPNELHPMFFDQVLPFLKQEYAALLPILDCRVLRIAGMGESMVEERIAPELKDLSSLEIGYCARPGEVDVRLVCRASTPEAAQQTAGEAEKRVRHLLGSHIYGAGSQTLEGAVVELLHDRHVWAATAESCTGGFLAHRLTLVPGSSLVFKQGWVTYSNETKTRELEVPASLIEKHGAASGEVALAMAEGARRLSGADYALSLTGIAGPGGGSPEKPVGTVFIALAGPDGTTVERHCFQLSREMFKIIASQTALNLLRKTLLQIPS
ncbi:MAG: competence/damage-inducible protein A [Verrucomicrobiae bacterium]|nr:competence/damage-inducible protein A [Verrucomicrobiae bacterium]